ncbi:MAG: hypothetical protein KDI46_05200 [Alphaproteobacteria bacterium]|nr:hypothetical protein [Alphaproteobacteria bacterium]
MKRKPLEKDLQALARLRHINAVVQGVLVQEGRYEELVARPVAYHEAWRDVVAREQLDQTGLEL